MIGWNLFWRDLNPGPMNRNQKFDLFTDPKDQPSTQLRAFSAKSFDLPLLCFADYFGLQADLESGFWFWLAGRTILESSSSTSTAKVEARANESRESAKIIFGYGTDRDGDGQSTHVLASSAKAEKQT